MTGLRPESSSRVTPEWPTAGQLLPGRPPSLPTFANRLAPPVARGFAQTFGLDVRAAGLVILVDLMLFGGDAFSLGLLIPLGVIVSGILGWIVYRMQRNWYGDDHDSALTKAVVVGLLTAIPVPLSPVLAVPCGTVGFFRMICRGGGRN